MCACKWKDGNVIECCGAHWNYICMIVAKETKRCDKISEEIGMEHYKVGDLGGWSACDEVGHRIRGDK